MPPVIAIVGRPNVGKSSLFNRLTRSKSALVDDRPGITRDRLHATLTYREKAFTLVDTGGFEDLGQDPLLQEVRKQVVKALEEADIVIFVTDGKEGVMPGDEEMADLLRRSRKEVYLAVNKIDGPEKEPAVLEFHSLGFHPVYPVSAAHGYGIRSLMDDVTEQLPESESGDEDEGRIRVAVLGRTNVGKSSLINRILGLDRLLVSDMPGTTRDAVDTPLDWHGKRYLLVDTAGIRRKARVKEKIEKFSVIKALRSLDRCHVAVVLLDASMGVSEQDARICGYAFEQAKALILAVNKWDLVKGDTSKVKRLDEDIHRQLQFVSFAPRVNLSALTGERVRKLLEKIDLVFEQYNRRLNTGAVNRALELMIEKHPPPRVGRTSLKFYYAAQVAVRPPTFTLFVNRTDAVHFSYERFLVNQIRENLGLALVPIRLKFKKR